MDGNLARMISTVIIWAALTAIAMTAIISGAEVNFIVAAIVMGTAMVATISIWDKAEKGEEKSAEKLKRRGRVDRMLESLSDAELDELRARLTESDGEMVGLDELLQEQRRRTRR